jgi:hypothetical protein
MSIPPDLSRAIKAGILDRVLSLLEMDPGVLKSVDRV